MVLPKRWGEGICKKRSVPMTIMEIIAIKHQNKNSFGEATDASFVFIKEGSGRSMRKEKIKGSMPMTKKTRTVWATIT